MLVIESYMDISPGMGIGLFAKANILKGTKYWIRNEVFDKLISKKQYESLDKLAADFTEIHGFLEVTQNWYLCCDNASFTNHSNFPNTKYYFDRDGLVKYGVASKNIISGEEIFCDYTKICLTCKNGLNF